jgi:Family of unknown function (DUF6788)
MKRQDTTSAAARQRQYARLRAQLARIGWISEGYVQDRRRTPGGASYPWTRKVQGKTVCVALSQEQYEWMREAIANWRSVQAILRQMQRLSRQELFETLPDPRRRKQLSKTVLGLA